MSNHQTQLVVIGGGPGGYAAAFHAADHGIETTLVDLEENPGGVCLYRGCIPSKALLHAAKLLEDSKEAKSIGLDFGKPKIDLDKLRDWKSSVVKKLTGGLGMLAKQRKINYTRGRAEFLNNNILSIKTTDDKTQRLEFEKAILATGSRASIIPGLPIESPHVWNSKIALDLPEIPKTMLIIGGGYIGLEMGCVYAALGTKITVVEMTDSILPGCDPDLSRVLMAKLKKQFEAIHLSTKVAEVKDNGKGVSVVLEGKESGAKQFDKVLVSVGRRPNTEKVGLENTKIQVGKDGFIIVDPQRRTAEPNIFAIGDVAGQPMLAHKATAEGKLAVDVIAGKKAIWEPRAIPAVVFTDPEIAYAGMMEAEAQAAGLDVTVTKFPWAASGRALTLGRSDGVTKLVCEKATGRVLGLGIAGPQAGDLIAEGVLAIEMGATAEDLHLSIHPHPTLSETIMEAAELVYGPATHYYGGRR
jgi:dihydrolipoamide dehydrogenase